jgi:hypothetical protein
MAGQTQAELFLLLIPEKCQAASIWNNLTNQIANQTQGRVQLQLESSQHTHLYENINSLPATVQCFAA